jgi:NAD(P)-dependent dehydrogenase (short-subunit alcohol dehydrogenase family)
VSKLLERYPLGVGTTEDVANLGIFLLSNEARWMTGQQVVLDGGRTINYSY